MTIPPPATSSTPTPARGRARFGSAFGFVLSGIGAAVGLGSFWRFPQLASQNGGGAFVLLFTLALAIFGVPLLWAELALGQRTQAGAVRAFQVAAGPRWRFVGHSFLAVCFVVAGYYCILAGYVLRYALHGFGEAMAGGAPYLERAVQGPDAVLYGIAIAALTAAIASFGIKRGLERANEVMMPALFVLLLGLVVYAQVQDGAAAGRGFYLGVTWSEIDVDSVQQALGQVFFAVGIGFGIMLTFASYTPATRSLPVTAVLINASILVVGFLAGLMVFPLAFASGLGDAVSAPDAGVVTTLFLTMPAAFGHIGGAVGGLLMVAFFVMLLFAAVSSTIALLETIVGHLTEAWGWGRVRSGWIATEWYLVPGVLAGASPAAFAWLDAFLSRVLLYVAALGLCLTYTFGIKDRVAFLIGPHLPSPLLLRSARVASSIIAFVAPAVLLALFLLGLPDTVDALLP